jgi:methylenetetrahydrofolate reductase (NADPH)
MTVMFNFPYIVELLSPKITAGNQLESLLDRFSDRYNRIIQAGLGVSIPDNPMGQPRMGAVESINHKSLTVEPDKVMMNLNTFHTKSDLDTKLKRAAKEGVKYILVVRGDGGPQLPHLDPKDIGGKLSVTTSIDLIRYINTHYANQFITGAAFNPYKPISFEIKRMEHKIDAGAKFIVTQPIIGKDENVDRLEGLNLPVVVEAWMSKNIDLLFKSVGKERDERTEEYDPVDNLKMIHDSYPGSCVYLSMLSFKTNWHDILPQLSP